MFVGLRRMVGALGLAALLAACPACSGSGSTPQTLPPVSGSPTPSASATATSRQAELAAAEAVVRQYFSLVNRLRVRMNAAAIGRLMTPDCRCREQVAAIRDAARRGEHYVDHASSVTLTPAFQDQRAVQVLVSYNASVGGLVDSHGRRVTTSRPRRGVKRLFSLRLVSDHWLIASIGAV
ncbi:MAG: hypothetical protein JO222_12715 [Frankiales bacterium]|nr:hypothetical protein [Frankiales bacterium]